MAKAKKQSRADDINSQTGPLYTPNTLFLRIFAGTATSPDGVDYELSYDPSGQPIIRSEKTGKWWSPGWERLIKMAEDAGINHE